MSMWKKPWERFVSLFEEKLLQSRKAQGGKAVCF